MLKKHQDVAPLVSIRTDVVKSEVEDYEKSVSSKGDEGFFEEFDDDKVSNFPESRNTSRLNLVAVV